MQRFVDACLEGRSSREAWLDRVAETAQPIVEGRGAMGAAAVIYSHTAGWSVGSFAARGAFLDVPSLKVGFVTPKPIQIQVFRPFAVSRLSVQLGKPTSALPFWRQVFPPRFRDAVAAFVPRGPAPVMLCSLLGEDGFQERGIRELHLMRRHLALGAGARFGGGDDKPDDKRDEKPDEEPDVVIDASGHVTHVKSPERATTLDLVTSGVRAIERARLGAEPDREGLALWDEMLANGWSVVDHVDTDGKRYLLLRRAVRTAGSAISASDRKALDLLAKGFSNKRIALELGVAQSTISARLESCLATLGFSSRVDYVRYALP